MSKAPAHRGFILQTSYRVANTAAGHRAPVIHLYGRLEDGGTFLVRDDRARPCFYIRTSQAQHAQAQGAMRISATDRHAFDGGPVSRIEVDVPNDVPALRDRLHAAGIETFEADVRFAVRYLIDRGIKGGCEIQGDAIPGKDATWIFDNPIVKPARVDIRPRVLSFDIETDLKGNRLLAISLFAPGIDEVLVVDSTARPMPEKATCCATEFAALEAFCARVRSFDPDVLTGWNIIDFDLTVLERIAQRVGHPLKFGRDSGAMRLRKAEGYFGSGQASIPGRLVLDGMDLVRGAFVRMEDYSLDTVAREVLGEGKVVHGDVRDRYDEIAHNYRHDLSAFALYARTDARLAYQIVEKLDLVTLAFARSRLAGMTPDRVSASIASFDFVYLSELEKRRVVAPTVRSDDSRVHVAQHGGHVLEPLAGLHRNVWVFDFKSLYPSVIRTFNIDPLSYVSPTPSPVVGEGILKHVDGTDQTLSPTLSHDGRECQSRDDLIRTPGGAFKREPAILPGILDELFPQREAAKQRGDAVAQNAIKILMNSFYGVLGTPACRFYNPALANSITGTGKTILLWSKHWFEAKGYKVLYGDTDSLFVHSGMDDGDAAVQLGRELAAMLNKEIALYIQERWRVVSKLELKFEKLYSKLFLSHARHSTRGASKRYAGLLHGTNKAEFVGMEVVRRDWTALAKQVQRELYQRLFTDQSVDAYLADIVKQVRAGKLDDLLVYRKNLRKDAQDYTATTPPHVAAARKSKQPLGRSIQYVMTTAGAEPLDNVNHPLDREHYVVKQVMPVAEPVLSSLGLEFEQVVGDNRQMDMLSMF